MLNLAFETIPEGDSCITRLRRNVRVEERLVQQNLIASNVDDHRVEPIFCRFQKGWNINELLEIHTNKHSEIQVSFEFATSVWKESQIPFDSILRASITKTSFGFFKSL